MPDRFDLVIIGMGSGGMPAAEFAASLPIRVAVVERDRVGGECLWTGCVPSKSLLASAKAAHVMRTADRWGLPAVEPEIDTEQVWKRIRAVQHDIATSDDDPRRFAALGVELVWGDARLLDAHTVAVGDRRLRARFVLVCTGSRPAPLPIDGLDDAGYLTNLSVFELERAPSSIGVIGGGPIGIELAQAFRRLGVRTTVLEKLDQVLPRDEPALVGILARILRDEGVELHLGVDIQRVRTEGGSKVIEGIEAGEHRRWEVEEILLAVGRTPNLDGLGLDRLGVETTPKGVVVDERMRSSVPSVYAAGDAAGRFLFTHSAGHEAVRAVRDMFFPGTGKVSELVPWCTFTDPELAHVGLTAAEARQQHGEGVEVHRVDLAHSDRARAEGHAAGAIIVVTAGGKVVGAHLLAPAAGELVHELALAVHKGLKLTELASMVHIYPTLGTSVAQLAVEAAYAGARRFHWMVPAARLVDQLRR